MGNSTLLLTRTALSGSSSKVKSRARCIAQKGEIHREEENEIFMGNGYPRSFVCFASATKPPRKHDGKGEEDKPSTVHLTYVAGGSECIRWGSKDFYINSGAGPTLCREASVFCAVLCTYTKVYIRETTRQLETRLKKHKDA